MGGLAVALATLALMLATEPALAIVWDEGYTLGREARLRLWFEAVRDPEAFAKAWQPPAEELVQQVAAPPPRAIRSIRAENSCSTPPCSPGSGRSHARNRTDIRHFTR